MTPMPPVTIVARRIAGILAAVVLFAGSPTIAADITGVADARARFDPFSGLVAVATLSVSLAIAPEDGPLSVVVQPSNGLPWTLRGLGTPLMFQIRTPDSRTVSSGSASAAVRAVEGSDSTIRFDILVPAPQFAQAGTYETELELTLLDAAGAPVSPPRFARVSIDVPIRAEANIAGASGAWGTMASVAFFDFGEMESGETLTGSLQVRANTDVFITATSLHGGRLMNQSPGSSMSVNYTVSIDGVGGRLASPLTLQRRPPQTLDGGNFPIRITLGDVVGAFAGVYRDTIQIDVIGR